MALVTLLGISAALFGLVTWFCATQGLFDAGPTRIFAFLLYAIWFGLTLLAGALLGFIDLVRH